MAQATAVPVPLPAKTARISDTPQAEEAERVKRSRPDELDDYCEDLQRAHAGHHVAATQLARGLNAARQFPVASRDADLSEATAITCLVSAILASHLTDAEKWAIQEMHRQRALLLGRVIGITSMLGAGYVQSLAKSGYVLDSFVADPKLLPRAQISGEIHRWLDTRCTDIVLKQVATMLGALADQGVEVHLGTNQSGQGYCRINYTHSGPPGSLAA